MSRRTRQTPLEPAERETKPQERAHSHLEGKWRDCVGIHADTKGLISAFIDRVFVAQYKMQHERQRRAA